MFYPVAVVFFWGKKTTLVEPVVNRPTKRSDIESIAKINRLVITRLFFLFKPGLHVRRKHEHKDVYTYDKHNRAARLLFGASFDSNMAD